MENQSVLEDRSVPAAVAAMAIPSVISSLVTVVYNMADTFFVGQTGDALQVAAVSLTNPIFILFMAFSNMLGMGSSAMASIALGEGDQERVKKISSFITWASFIIGIVLAVVLLVFTRPILSLFGVGEETYEFAKGYTVYVAIGAPAIIWSAAASFIVRAEGASSEAMIGNMIGTFANIILDPLFISGFHQGAAGAAIATSIANIMACVYYAWYFLRKSKYLSMSIRHANCGITLARKICAAGLPTAMFSVLMSVSTIILNQILVNYGNEPVAAIGIVFKVNMFVTFIQMGLANGVQPLLGFSYGADNRKRFVDVEHFSKICCFAIGILATVFCYFFRDEIIRLFIADEDVVSYGVKMLTAYIISGPFVGFLFMNMNCLQSTNHALPATILSVLRQGLLLIPLFYILDALVGLNGVIYGQCITDIITILLSIFLWNHAKAAL